MKIKYSQIIKPLGLLNITVIYYTEPIQCKIMIQIILIMFGGDNLCYLSDKIKIKSYLSELYGLTGYRAHFLSCGLCSSDCDNFKCRTSLFIGRIHNNCYSPHNSVP